MKGLDVTVVRFIPFIICFHILYVLYKAWNGISVHENEFVFGNSFIFAFSMFIISISNKKYHCKWNRAQYLVLMILPIIGFIDYKFDIISEAEHSIIITTSLIVASLIYTFVMSLNHFLFKRIRKAWNYLMKTS